MAAKWEPRQGLSGRPLDYEAHIRSILQRDLDACKGCHVDITLKDVQTVESDPDRVRQWVKLVRDIADG